MEVKVICKKGIFTTRIYSKRPFSSMYSNVESNLSPVCTFDMVYTRTYVWYILLWYTLVVTIY